MPANSQPTLGFAAAMSNRVVNEEEYRKASREAFGVAIASGPGMNLSAVALLVAKVAGTKTLKMSEEFHRGEFVYRLQSAEQVRRVMRAKLELNGKVLQAHDFTEPAPVPVLLTAVNACVDEEKAAHALAEALGPKTKVWGMRRPATVFEGGIRLEGPVLNCFVSGATKAFPEYIMAGPYPVRVRRRDACWTCGQTGHHRTSCPSPSSRSGCWKCGKPGHFAARCPGEAPPAGTSRVAQQAGTSSAPGPTPAEATARQRAEAQEKLAQMEARQQAEKARRQAQNDVRQAEQQVRRNRSGTPPAPQEPASSTSPAGDGEQPGCDMNSEEEADAAVADIVEAMMEDRLPPYEPSSEDETPGSATTKSRSDKKKPRNRAPAGQESPSPATGRTGMLVTTPPHVDVDGQSLAAMVRGVELGQPDGSRDLVGDDLGGTPMAGDQPAASDNDADMEEGEVDAEGDPMEGTGNDAGTPSTMPHHAGDGGSGESAAAGMLASVWNVLGGTPASSATVNRRVTRGRGGTLVEPVDNPEKLLQGGGRQR